MLIHSIDKSITDITWYHAIFLKYWHQFRNTFLSPTVARLPIFQWAGYKIHFQWAGYRIQFQWEGYRIPFQWAGYRIHFQWAGYRIQTAFLSTLKSICQKSYFANSLFSGTEFLSDTHEQKWDNYKCCIKGSNSQETCPEMVWYISKCCQ